MKQCGYCGLSSEDRSFLCPFCGHRLPGAFLSSQARARVLLTIVIPPVIWVVMTELAGL